MTTATRIVTSSTNIESGTTTSITATLPPSVMGLLRGQRGLAASRIVAEDNRSLENVEDQLPTAIDPLLEGKQESTFIRDGAVVNVFNISGPNVLKSFPRFLLPSSFFRDLLFSEILFHEVGHHIHKAQAPEHQEREDVAEKWRKRISRRYFWKRYWYVLMLLYPVKPIIDRLSSRFEKKRK